MKYTGEQICKMDDYELSRLADSFARPEKESFDQVLDYCRNWGDAGLLLNLLISDGGFMMTVTPNKQIRVLTTAGAATEENPCRAVTLAYVLHKQEVSMWGKRK